MNDNNSPTAAEHHISECFYSISHNKSQNCSPLPKFTNPRERSKRAELNKRYISNSKIDPFLIFIRFSEISSDGLEVRHGHFNPWMKSVHTLGREMTFTHTNKVNHVQSHFCSLESMYLDSV